MIIALMGVPLGAALIVMLPMTFMPSIVTPVVVCLVTDMVAVFLSPDMDQEVLKTHVESLTSVNTQSIVVNKGVPFTVPSDVG